MAGCSVPPDDHCVPHLSFIPLGDSWIGPMCHHPWSHRVDLLVVKKIDKSLVHKTFQIAHFLPILARWVYQKINDTEACSRTPSPANMRGPPGAALLWGRYRKRWPNICSASDQRLVFDVVHLDLSSLISLQTEILTIEMKISYPRNIPCLGCIIDDPYHYFYINVCVLIS